jgi:hypothetical protein
LRTKRISISNHPEVKDPEKTGIYPATAHAGGGYETNHRKKYGNGIIYG